MRNPAVKLTYPIAPISDKFQFVEQVRIMRPVGADVPQSAPTKRVYQQTDKLELNYIFLTKL